MVRNKNWFKEFEKHYRDSAEVTSGFFAACGSERLRAYRVLSELESVTSRLWGMMRIEEEEDKREIRDRQRGWVDQDHSGGHTSMTEDAKIKKTWFDNIHDIYNEGLRRTKSILHDDQLPWSAREKKCLEALVEIKKMMVACRPPEVIQQIASEASDEVVGTAVGKVVAYCKLKGSEDAAEETC